MKYFSELTNKHYDTELECKKAEETFLAEEAAKEKEATLVRKEKKELSKAIEAAEAEVDVAYEQYKQVREEATKLIADAEQKANAMVSEAYQKVKAARENKYKAVAAFNDKYGTYVVQYNSDKALKELRRSTEWINDIFGHFFWN